MQIALNLGIIIASVLITLAVGLEVDRAALYQALRMRARVLILWVLQAVIPPLIALVLVHLLNLPFHAQAGLLLLAACPVGDIANAYTMLARGPIICSLAVNALSCLTAPITMGVAYMLYGLVLKDSFYFMLPTPVLVTRVFLLAVLPIIVGVAIRSLFPRVVDLIRPWVRNVCGLSIVFLIVYVLMGNWNQVRAEGVITGVAALLFLVITLASGWWVGHSMRMSRAEQGCAAFVIGVRNLGMLAAVAIVLMGHAEYAVFGAVYFLIEVPLAFALIKWINRGRA
jgi:BASS family bile acid:Na+ symporter